jgi:hypothetical protein
MIRSNLSKAKCAIAVTLSLMLSGAASAADAPAKKSGASDTTTTLPYDIVEWGGLGWGLGLAANFDVTGARVGTATVVNNIVRIQDGSSNVNLGFVLEAHYFLRDYIFSNGGLLSVCPKPGTCVDVAYGPFVAIEVGGGTSSTISATGAPTAYALGMMVGLHHQDAPKNQSWNFGVGLRVDPKAQVLGDGIVANQPLPAGESTTVRFKTEPRVGIMLLSSFSF